MCVYVDSLHGAPGWDCCRCSSPCHEYNDGERTTCEACGAKRCEPLAPDPQTGRNGTRKVAS